MEAGEVPEVRRLDRHKPAGVALDGMAIGVGAEIETVKALLGDGPRIALFLFDALQHLRAHAAHRIGIEARMGQR